MNEETKLKVEFYTKLIDNNYNKLKVFFDHSFIQFCELNFLKDEILTCQLFELFQSSIFGTNHLLERMIKLSLIKKHTIECDYSDLENYSEKLKESESDFDGLTLNNSLKKALENELISESEYDILFDIKNEFRNPYSHAEVGKVIKNDNDFRGFMFNFKDVNEKLKSGKPIDIPEHIIIPKFSPAIAQFLQEHNSRQLAFEYFKNVFGILKKLEIRITELKNKKH